MISFIFGPEDFIRLHNSYQFITLLYGPWIFLPIFSQKSSKVTFFSIFRKSAPGIPWWLTPQPKHFDLMCQTMNLFSNLPHTCCCSCCSLYHCCCFSFFFAPVLVIFFWPPWAFGPVHCSWFMTIILLYEHIFANRNKVCLIDSSCSYIICWWR